MSDSRTFLIEHKNERWRDVLGNALATVTQWAEAGDLMLVLSDIKRTLDQNAAMWPALRDFARQVPWPVNGETKLIDPEDWKDILTAAFEQETRFAPAIGGGFVMLGARTSRYGKRKMGEFLTFVRAEGDQRDVRWSAPARENFLRYIPVDEAA